VQVVRRSASPDGYVTEECLDMSGGWQHSYLIEDSIRGKIFEEFYRLNANDVDACIAIVRRRWPAS
jgi:hypothetical protein